jgi:hypothetical protein
MASAQEKFIFNEKNDSAIYEAAIKAVPLAGLQVWKKRELAQLVLAQGNVEGAEVRCNIAVSMVDGSTTISAESEDLSEEKLGAIINEIKAKMDISLA